jgi:ribose transport system substrate-binding protein
MRLGRLSAAIRAGLCVALGAGFAMSVAASAARAAEDFHTPTDAEKAAVMAKVPAGAKENYEGYWYFSSVEDSPYASKWTPPAPPWQVCFNDSFLSIPWRAEMYDEIKKLNAQYNKAGMTKADVLVTDSNNKIDLQLSQFNNLVRQGCNVIISIPGSPSGLCSGYKDAFDKGVLVVTIQSAVACPEAINVGSPQYADARKQAQWLVDALHGKGNVVMLMGVPGLSTTVAEQAGAADAFKAAPGITLIGTVYGFWSPPASKTEMVKFIATHPQQIDGVWAAGNMSVSAGDAIKQSGRPPAIHANGTNECSFIAYWKENKLHSFAFSAGGAPNGYEGFLVAIRMMYGQKPIVNTLLFPATVIDDNNMEKWWRPDISVQSSCSGDSPDGRLVADSYFDQFLQGGKPVEPAPQP